MAININNNYKAIYKGATKLVDNNRNSKLKYRDNEQWDTFEEIIGFPHMFNNNADPKKVKSGTSSQSYGRVFTNTIIADNNLVFIEPGTPKFLDSKWYQSQKNKEIRQQVLKDLANGASDNIQSIFEKGGFKADSRYYSFESAFTDYMQIVNSMATYVAIRMGLFGQKDNVMLMALSRGGNTFSKTCIPFYFDAQSTQYSEGFSNSTTDSQLAGALKSIGSMIREADFLLNGKASNGSIMATATDYVTEKLGSLAGKIPGIGNSLENLTGMANMSLKGANLLFPEIWGDSATNRSITLGFKFSSPYGDKLSIFNNVLFPTICLMALTLPRMKGNMGYTAPFLIKAYAKGWFNCDLGMVESLNITKGPGNMWSVDNLPLQIECTLTIKDLYPTLMVTQGSASTMMSRNSGLAEYLETFAGVSVTHANMFAPIAHKHQSALWDVGNSFNKLLTGLEVSTLHIFPGPFVIFKLSTIPKSQLNQLNLKHLR